MAKRCLKVGQEIQIFAQSEDKIVLLSLYAYFSSIDTYSIYLGFIYLVVAGSNKWRQKQAAAAAEQYIAKRYEYVIFRCIAYFMAIPYDIFI